MELQWPLILFTAFIAWSCGLFATQGFFALKKESAKAQMPALIMSVVLLVVGGIAVFFHLHHWERIFNGFGHITSGITQELICIVLMVIVAVIFFVFLRKDPENVPSWVAILAIVIAVITAAITAHSYMMASRPAWNSFLWLVCMVGNACVLGPMTFGVIDASANKAEGKSGLVGKIAFYGAIVGAVAMLLYVFSLAAVGGSFEPINYYYDPTEPMREMVDANKAADLFASQYALVLWLGVVVIGAVAPVLAGFMAKKKIADSNVLTWCGIGLVAAVIGVICVRMLFFMMGASVFIFY